VCREIFKLKKIQALQTKGICHGSRGQLPVSNNLGLVVFVVDKVALTQVFLPVLVFYLVSIIPPCHMLICSSVTDTTEPSQLTASLNKTQKRISQTPHRRFGTDWVILTVMNIADHIMMIF
jgi:hypothetical protein